MIGSRASKIVALIVGLGACGGARQPGAGEPASAAPAATGKTPLDQRRDAACEQLGPKMTACAVEDARAAAAAGRANRAQVELDTAPDVQRTNTEQFIAACKSASYSSRQVRVLEVCFREETACEPLLACLENLKNPAP